MPRTKRPKDLEEAAILARALGHPNRMKMVVIMAFDGAVPFNDLVDSLKLPQPIVSRHLGHLRRTRMVESRRADKQVVYSIHRDLRRNSGFCDLFALLAKVVG